jgi:hypothetical protein
MSVVLRFSQELARRPLRPIGQDEPRGEILFFTGVRFERHCEPESDSGSDRRGNTQGRRRRKA